MIRTAFKSATVIAGLVLLASGVLQADSLGQSNDRKHRGRRAALIHDHRSDCRIARCSRSASHCERMTSDSSSS